MDVNVPKLTKDYGKIVGKDHVRKDEPTSVVYAKYVMLRDLEEKNN